MAIVVKIKQLTNNNVQFLDQSGKVVGIFLPGTQWSLDGSTVRTTTRNQFPFIIKPSTIALLEYKSGLVATFNGNAQQLLTKFYEPGGFFFNNNLVDDFVGLDYTPNSEHSFLFNDNKFRVSVAANTLIARKIFIRKDTSIYQIYLKYSNAGPGASVVGIYDLQGGKPVNLIVQTGQYNAAIISSQFATIPNTTLKKGFYSIAYWANVTKDMVCSSNSNANPNFGSNSLILPTNVYVTYRASLPYSPVMPSVFPAGVLSTDTAPYFVFRISP